jgi:tetratricopeptide (TPR) repeat protein
MAESEILRLNQLAMEKLCSGFMSEALTILNECQELLKSVNLNSEAWGVTFSNLGCYFKKTKDYKTALSHFAMALEVFLTKPFDVLSLSSTYINLSSMHSELKQHEQAVSCCIKAQSLLKNAQAKDQAHIIALVASYHCLGKELNFLNRKIEAVNIFKEGWEIAKSMLGKEHKLSISMRRVVERNMEIRTNGSFVRKLQKKKNTSMRSHSSKGQTRDILPQIYKKNATPTKEYYFDVGKIKKNRLTKITIPSKKYENLNNLVSEIEKGMDNKQKKYVFKRNLNENELISTHLDADLPSLHKTPLQTTETSNQKYLHVIPESTNEDQNDRHAKPQHKPKAN